MPQEQAELAKRTVEETFLAEMQRGEVQTVDLREDCCILAMVGDGMIERLGMAGKFFTALGKAGVNVRAIAQGSSERNISAVIEQHEATKALRAVHSAFYLSSQTLSIGVIGTGLIGGTFLNQLSQRLEMLRTRRGIDLRVRGIMNSRKMHLHDRQLNLAAWDEELRASTTEADIEQFVEQRTRRPPPACGDHRCHRQRRTTSALRKLACQRNQHHHAEQKGNVGPLAEYRSLRETARRGERYFLYETNVGAGLPIIHTLRDLLETGDEIIRIEGVLSGTLSYIFNSFDGTRTFSQIVREARARGFTEPDPREDLSGVDVARKLIILAREMGLEVEMDAVEVESLVPEDLRSADVEEYLSSLGKHDQAVADLLNAARARGRVLRYVGAIEVGEGAKVDSVVRARVGPFAGVSADHSFSRILTGSDNIVKLSEHACITPTDDRKGGRRPEVTRRQGSSLICSGSHPSWERRTNTAAAARSATVFAPATVANVAVGFDILGSALESVGDVVTVSDN